MEQQESAILNGLYKNASVGVKAIETILEKTQHPTLRDTLCEQLQYYQAQKQTAREQLQADCVQPEEEGTLAKFWSDLSIKMHSVGGTNTSEVAKMMTEGTNMGIIQLTQVLHRHPDAPDKLKRQGKETIRHEEAYLKRLKAYL